MRLWLIWVQIYSFCYSNECYLSSDLQARGLRRDGALCSLILPGRSSYTHLFLYQPTLTKSRPPPHHQQPALMYNTSRSSICFCPAMKRSIIICRTHSWRATSCVWANQGRTPNLDHNSERPPSPPPPQAIFIIRALCLRSCVGQVFITTLFLSL